MKRRHVYFGKGFKVLMGNQRVQVAQMTLSAGDREGGPTNRHRGSDQWLFVASGRGTAIIMGRSCALRPGTLLLIEHGEDHEIRSTGRLPLKTLNFYNPPGYTTSGNELPAAKPPARQAALRGRTSRR